MIEFYTWKTPNGRKVAIMQAALGDSLADKPAIHDWLARVGDRPAVQAGMNIPGRGWWM